jgi:hypothetical protein
LKVWEAPDLKSARTLVEDYFAQLIERQRRLGLSPEMAPGRDEDAINADPANASGEAA